MLEISLWEMRNDMSQIWMIFWNFVMGFSGPNDLKMTIGFHSNK
jgi:hypothetical protein